MTAKNTLNKKLSKRTLKHDGKFVLVPVRIDGDINLKHAEFENYSEVQTKLPELLINARGYGEWEVKLYQVPQDFKWQWNRNLMCYFPNKGKTVFNLNYMEPSIYGVFLDDQKIQFNMNSDLDNTKSLKEMKLLWN